MNRILETRRRDARKAVKDIVAQTKYAIKDLRAGLREAAYQAAYDAVMCDMDLYQLNAPLAAKIAGEAVEELIGIRNCNL
jgi:hypothetical protein